MLCCTEWLTVANFEENANRQTTSNIETVEEVDVTQQVTLVAAGDTVVGLKMNQKENCGSVKRETENGVHLLEHQKFDGNQLRSVCVCVCVCVVCVCVCVCTRVN